MKPPRVLARPGSTFFPVVLALLAASPGCRGNSEPEPKKASETPVIAPPKRPERTGPFRSPKESGPPPRTEPQLPPEELSNLLRQAEAAIGAGETDRAILLLRRCANRIPPSSICEGRLSLLLLPKRAYKAEAEYYLAEAIQAEDPRPVDLDRELAAAARRRGRMDLAAVALSRVTKSKEATPTDWALLGQALSADRKRLEEAVKAFDAALATKDEPDWIYERAVLLAQLGRNAEAIEAFEAYLEAPPEKDPRLVRAVQGRIAELRTGKVADHVPAPKAAAKDDAKHP